ncbi:MAG: GNAT family N-acetyltransferase [Anaerorhabdus sp.]|uniref:GNAT family N-acetyltransferase n=1 Tax=Anaerorhabdus sp. TaxID=1872524 RepID=UPI003A8B6DBA
MVNTPTLETPRLRLRKFSKNDLEALLMIFSDFETNTYLPWFLISTLEEARMILNTRYLETYMSQEGYNYAICLKTDDIPIGYINVSTDEIQDLGYGLRKNFWHKGIVTEAGKVILEQIKKDGIPYITATHDIKNVRSGEVMKYLGMRYQYSYEELWKPKNILVTFRMYQLNFDPQDTRVYRTYWNKYALHFIETDI